MRKCFLILSLIIASNYSFSQVNSSIDSVNFYGSLRSIIAIYEDNTEMQNNSSRIGLNLNSKSIKGFSVHGGFELGINLLKSNNTFNPDAATSATPDAFLVETVKPLTTRLGYIGINSTKWGSLIIGKQWGVYYDVSSFTDKFNVFGSLASGTYNTGTDGGGEGTGRADNAITYRKTWDFFSLGLQAQFPDKTNNFGVSTKFKLSKSINLGVAYNYYQIPKVIKLAITNSGNYANSIVSSLNYKSQKTYFAFTVAYNQSEILYPSDTNIVAFSGLGLEFFIKHAIKQRCIIYAGVNYLEPVQNYTLISNYYKIMKFPIGISYLIFPNFQFYSEVLIDNGRLVDGKRGKNVFTLGLKYDFNLEYHKTNNY